MNKTGLLLFLLLSVIGFAGCDKNPVNRLIDPTVNNTAGQWSGTWVIYGDEFKYGSLMFYTTTEGQDIDFAWPDNPHSGSRCFKFAWDGGEVTAYDTPGVKQTGYVGFGNIVADRPENYAAVFRDLTPGGYTKVSFWVKGSLNADVVVRLEANNGNKNTDANAGVNVWESNSTTRRITGDWQRYEFALAGDLSVTRDFIKILIVNRGLSRSNGGVVYLDDIQLSI